MLPGDGALYLLAALAAPGGSRPTPKARLKSQAKTALSALPSGLVYRLLPPWKGPELLSPAKLAFRALLASRTIALLEKDASVLEKEAPSTARRQRARRRVSEGLAGRGSDRSADR